MKKSSQIALLLLFAFSAFCHAQQGGRGKAAMDVPDNPLPIGEAGVAWYTTWETGLEEAKRTNRPIFFMSAATTCSGIPGVF